MDLGVLVSVHSDDPAFFGGDITDNFMEILATLGKNE